MKAHWLNDWEDGALTKMLEDFDADAHQLDGCNILVASYTYENYSGKAYALYERGGKLFEVYGSHCSCYGLAGQWEPEETSVVALRYALMNGYKYEWDDPGVLATLGEVVAELERAAGVS